MAFRNCPEVRERQSRPDVESDRTSPMIRPGIVTRRKMITAMATAAAGAVIGGAAFGQGISSPNVKPQPRGKPSGRPFQARLTDVAKQAGLTQPVIYGGI